MKIINIQLIQSNSPANKNLIDFLNTHLSTIVRGGYKFTIAFVKGDGKTGYPRAHIPGISTEVVGVNSIKNTLIKVLENLNQNRRKVIGGRSELHQHNLKELYNNLDSDDDDAMEAGIDQETIQNGMQRLQEKRSNRINADDMNDMAPAKKSKKKKSKTDDKPRKKKKSNNKMQKVIEQMNDDDIGGAFSVVGKTKDDILMEAMYANNVETPHVYN